MKEGLSRRDVIKVTALAGGGLAVGWVVNINHAGASGISESTALGAKAIGPFVRLLPDNTLEFVLDRVEMGQGTATSQPMLLCAELDFPLDQVRIVHAPASKDYVNSAFGSQMTGGSTSVVEGHEKLRRAGAEVRERLRRAASRAWNCELEDVVAQQGVLTRRSAPQSVATYGSFASDAAAGSSPSVVLKPWSELKLLGSTPHRVDALAKSTGQAVFGIDAAPEGSAVAVLVRPPRPGLVAQPLTKGSQDQKGVLGVVSLPIGVAVVAERYWQARAAAQSLEVTWSPTEGAVTLNSSDLLEKHTKAANTKGRSFRDDGDWAKTFRQATQKIQADYNVPYLAHATMEPPNAVVQLFLGSSGPESPLVEIWSGSQVPDLLVSEVAELLECPRERVRYHNVYLGGGFGRRLRADYVLEALLIAKAAQPWLGNRPLQLVFSREDDLKHDDYRPMASCHMMGSLDANKKLSSLFCRIASQSILRQYAPDLVQTMAPQWLPLGVSRSAAQLVARFAGPKVSLEGVEDLTYECDHVGVEFAEIEAPVRVGFWRSVGHSYTAFFVESFMDEMAHLAGVDPYTFRLNHLRPGDRRRAVLERVAQLSGWGSPLPQGVFEGLAVHKSFGSYVAQVCRVSVAGSEVQVLEVFCVVDCGRVVHPGVVKSQMESGIIYGLSAALYGEINHDAGAVVQGNFDDYPVLRCDVCPRMVTEVLESNEDPTGAGEPGTPPIAPALCNALFRATGKRIRALPVLKALAATP